MTFSSNIKNWYTYKGESILLGAAKKDDEVYSDLAVRIPMKTLNRHWLIAWATGTWKTKTVQILCEQLSKAWVPTLVMDIKGDLSGLAQPWDETNEHIQERHELLGFPYEAMKFPVELLTLSDDQKWVRLRTTISEFGPILLSKILWLNETQLSVISLIFKLCDDRWLWLLDLNDLKTVLKWLKDTWKDELEEEYGTIQDSTLWTITRKIIMLEQQWADQFFGEPSFEVYDLLRQADWWKWVINIMRVMELQDRPHLFSTFMLSLLAELYETFPEQWDSDKPKLVIVIDEAHLIFKEASKELLSQLETTVKLIRSKWIGLFFCTQLPDDVPGPVLSQLWCKIQHALRWFTERDRKAIKIAVENYPISEDYNVDQLIMELWIGEAFVTCLNEKWIPTPLVHTYLQAPQSRMDVLTQTEVDNIVGDSMLVMKYEKTIDRESAYEILQKEIESEIDRNWKKKEWKWLLWWLGIDDLIKSKFAKTIAKEAGNALVRGVLWAIGLKVDGRRKFF